MLRCVLPLCVLSPSDGFLCQRFDSDPLTDVSSDRRNTSDRPLSITPLLSHSRISLLSEPNGPMTTRPTATAPLTSVPAEIRPLSSIEGSSTEMSVVSGHTSSSEHDAVLRSIVSRAYENWKIADSAAQRLLADLRAVEECEMQLGLARKRRREEQKRCVYVMVIYTTPQGSLTGSFVFQCA